MKLRDKMKWRRQLIALGMTLAALMLASGGAAWAQVNDAGAVTRDIEKQLPNIKPEAPVLPGQQKQAPASQMAETPLQTLTYPITTIKVDAPRLTPEIEALLRPRFLGVTSITQSEINQARESIWSLFRGHGRLVQITFEAVSGEDEKQGSRLDVHITEFHIRKTVVEQEGPDLIAPGVIERIRRVAVEKAAEGGVLDLGKLDAMLKHRIYLGDVTVRASIEPVKDNLVDLKILVGKVPPQPLSALVQYDNTGNWTFGRDRLITGVSLQGVVQDGDRLDVIGLKTFDVGALEFRGVEYGRVSYEIPVPVLDIRAALWTSAMHYHSDSGVTATSNANGNSYEIGAGVRKLLYVDSTAFVTASVDYLEKWETDRLLTNVATASKNSHNGRITIDATYALSQTQTLTARVSGVLGSVDLSGVASSLSADQSGPRVNGLYSKVEGDLRWLGRFGADNRIDARSELKFQIACKNLDSMEKFSLGGSSGLRAFSSSEAPGDHGFVLNNEIGYQLFPWLHSSVFYDIGGTVRSHNTYAVETIPNSYILQDVGASLAGSYAGIDANVSFAWQIGPNPARSPAGYDVDNTTDRYRLFGSLVYRY